MSAEYKRRAMVVVRGQERANLLGAPAGCQRPTCLYRADRDKAAQTGSERQLHVEIERHVMIARIV